MGNVKMQMLKLLVSLLSVLISVLPVFKTTVHLPFPGQGENTDVQHIVKMYSLLQNLMDTPYVTAVYAMIISAVLSAVCAVLNMTSFSSEGLGKAGNILCMITVLLLIISVILSILTIRRY